MADTRSLVEKLEAMARQTSSPLEAEVARSMLESLAGTRARKKTPGVLTREAVFDSSDRDSPARGVRVRMPSGYWIHLDEDQVAWGQVISADLQYRFDDEAEIRRGRPQ